jgi:hypothetical protein
MPIQRPQMTEKADQNSPFFAEENGARPQRF